MKIVCGNFEQFKQDWFSTHYYIACPQRIHALKYCTLMNKLGETWADGTDYLDIREFKEGFHESESLLCFKPSNNTRGNANNHINSLEHWENIEKKYGFIFTKERDDKKYLEE